MHDTLRKNRLEDNVWALIERITAIKFRSLKSQIKKIIARFLKFVIRNFHSNTFKFYCFLEYVTSIKEWKILPDMLAFDCSNREDSSFPFYRPVLRHFGLHLTFPRFCNHSSRVLSGSTWRKGHPRTPNHRHTGFYAGPRQQHRLRGNRICWRCKDPMDTSIGKKIENILKSNYISR